MAKGKKANNNKTASLAESRRTNPKAAKFVLSSKDLTSIPAIKETTQNLYDQLKLSESYVSLILGAVVVVVLTGVFFIFIKESNNFKSNVTVPSAQIVAPDNSRRTYTLQEGEGLWDVAVKFYGDGYKWVNIAEANNLTEEQANALGPGAKIIIPNLK